MPDVEIRERSFPSQVIGVLGKHADERRIIDDLRIPISGGKSVFPAKAANNAHFTGMSNRGCAGLKLKDISEFRIRPALVKTTRRTRRRLVEVNLPAQASPFLTKVREFHSYIPPDLLLNGHVPVLYVRVGKLLGCREDARSRCAGGYIKRRSDVELWQYISIVPENKAVKGRVQT